MDMGITHGMMRAPNRATASLVAFVPLNLGTTIPITTSSALGLACTITLKKHPPTTNTRMPIASSSFLI